MSKGAFVVATIAVLGAIAGVIAAVQYNQSTTVLVANMESQTVKDLWAHWKLAYGKMYDTEAMEAQRFSSFQSNYNFILRFNANPEETSTVGLNQFADLTSAEFKAQMECITPLLMAPEVQWTPTEEQVNANPASVNWVTAGAVTPIKNQGQCGSCWAFSTTGSLEGLNFLTNKNLLSFSEQQLVDCSTSYGNQGCDGGLMDYAFEYVEAYGIELESTYPYTAQDGTCAYNASATQFKNTGYTNVAQNNEVALQTAVVAQPISVAIEADQSVFQLYTSGVITSKACGTSLDHGVLAVGYNTATVSGKAVPYWQVKNSWGASWGNQGFVWIGRSTSTNTPGICGIAMMPSYPTV